MKKKLLMLNVENNIHIKSIYKCIKLRYQMKERTVPKHVMVKAMDCGIVVREFVLQLRYYVHFRENTLGKGMNRFILPAMG